MESVAAIRMDCRGKWGCREPVVYFCPVCDTRKCLKCSPISKPPSKRRCCMRAISEGEIQAWKRGDETYTKALILNEYRRREFGVIGLHLRNAYKVPRGDVSAALDAAGAWAWSGNRYLALAKKDFDQAAQHIDCARLCARNSGICAKFAEDWSPAPIEQATKYKNKGGLTLLPLLEDEQIAPVDPGVTQ